MNRFGGGSKSTSTGANSKAAGGGKRKAEVSPRKMEPITKKRSALGDLTNVNIYLLLMDPLILLLIRLLNMNPN